MQFIGFKLLQYIDIQHIDHKSDEADVGFILNRRLMYYVSDTDSPTEVDWLTIGVKTF